MNQTVFIYEETAAYPLLQNWTARAPFARKIVLKLGAHLEYRRNLRVRQYMEDAAAHAFEEFHRSSVIHSDQIKEMDWKHIDKVVLLWSDANGLGWFPIETLLLRFISPNTRVMVLNGRRRILEFRESRARVFTKRILEKTFAIDLLLSAAFFFVTPFLVAADTLRGRR
jgi:hypothetical protein